MITTIIFRCGPIAGIEQQVDATQIEKKIVFPRCVTVDDRNLFFSTCYSVDNVQGDKGLKRDNHGRIIYDYRGSVFLHERKRISWAESFGLEKTKKAVANG